MSLPPYSLDYSPIENMYSKINICLRKLSVRTDDEFNNVITTVFKSINKSYLDIGGNVSAELSTINKSFWSYEDSG